MPFGKESQPTQKGAGLIAPVPYADQVLGFERINPYSKLSD